jgi:hypothetical protein
VPRAAQGPRDVNRALPLRDLATAHHSGSSIVPSSPTRPSHYSSPPTTHRRTGCVLVAPCSGCYSPQPCAAWPRPP